MGSRNPKELLVVLCAIAVLVFTCSILSGCDSEKSQAQTAYQNASAALEEKNTELEDAISKLRNVMDSGSRPLDENVVTMADSAIGNAQSIKMQKPEMANTAEEIQEQVETIEKVDYSEAIATLAEAQLAYEDSVKQREQLTNPPESFVIQRLTGVEHVQTPTAVTEDNDPNEQLGKQGGYTATVYFASDLVPQEEIDLAKGALASLGKSTDVVGVGTEGGGAVEVFANEEDAKSRDALLASFDGGPYSSGSHHIYGTCIVRTSNHLKASQQKELESLVVEALTRLE